MSAGLTHAVLASLPIQHAINQTVPETTRWARVIGRRRSIQALIAGSPDMPLWHSEQYLDCREGASSDLPVRSSKNWGIDSPK
jgi:hypothetical protein